MFKEFTHEHQNGPFHWFRKEETLPELQGFVFVVQRLVTERGGKKHAALNLPLQIVLRICCCAMVTVCFQQQSTGQLSKLSKQKAVTMIYQAAQPLYLAFPATAVSEPLKDKVKKEAKTTRRALCDFSGKYSLVEMCKLVLVVDSWKLEKR